MHNESCCEWLRARASLGDEIVLHGYFHQRARQPGESAKAKLTTRIYTADEGELFDLNYTTARELLTRGREDFRKLALDPVGFIAPAWLLGTEAERAVRELGFTYTTRLGSVLDFTTGIPHSAQSLVWSVRSAWRRQMSLAWNATLAVRLRSNPLLRISIHPVDLKHPQIWSQIERLITSALRDRSALTYAEWIARTDKQLTVPDLV